MKVKMIVGMAGPGGPDTPRGNLTVYNPGDEVEFADEVATRLVEAGSAVPVRKGGGRKATAPPPERATED